MRFTLEGEEDEETLHTSRVKIYRLGVKDDKPNWTEMGVGKYRQSSYCRKRRSR